MEKIKLIFATVGALAGVTGAYATHRPGDAPGNVVYNWYVPDGQLAFIATVAVAKSACPDPGVIVCLRGTAANYAPVTLFRP